MHAWHHAQHVTDAQKMADVIIPLGYNATRAGAWSGPWGILGVYHSAWHL